VRLRTEDGLALKEIAKRLGVKNPVSSQYWVTRFKRGGDRAFLPSAARHHNRNPGTDTADTGWFCALHMTLWCLKSSSGPDGTSWTGGKMYVQQISLKFLPKRDSRCPNQQHQVRLFYRQAPRAVDLRHHRDESFR